MKLLIYFIYPIVTLLWCGLIGLGMGSTSLHAMYGLLITSSMIMWLEMLLDNFVYGGILAKDTNKLEYLKTSHKGMDVLKMSLVVDKLRRFLASALLLGVVYCVCHEQVNIGQLISLILVTAALTELGVLITRHFSSLNWTLIIAMIANSVGVIIGVIAVRIPWFFVILFLATFVAVAIVSNRVIMKKANQGFYDVVMESR